MSTNVHQLGTPAKPTSGPSKGRYAFIALGCPKNLVDSERMLGMLQLEGYELVADPQGADFAIVNTCGFIEQARTESFAAIDEMLAMKRRGDLRGVIVSGCLAERQQQALLVERPDIDHLVGVFGREEVTKVADRLIAGLDEQRHVFKPAPVRALSDTQRMRVTPRHFSYLKISEGCDRLCTFCAIPKMRGKHATKPMENVIAEARELAADGVKELVVVAQDTTYYGIDMYGEPRLVELLAELEKVDGIEWIRLMYLYPMYFGDDLIDAIAASDKIVPYLDMPLQHASDRMLKRMQRRVNKTDTVALVKKLRSRIDDLVLRTTMLVGFPGETEDDFSELVDFVGEHQFERLGVFSYSLEPDTPAARLPGHLPEEVKEVRRETLMAAQQAIGFDWAEKQVGKQLPVLIDTPLPEQEGVWIGRTYGDAPDVDCVVYVSGEGIKPGDFVDVEVVARSDYDLAAAAL